jgi:hypothetical protein
VFSVHGFVDGDADDTRRSVTRVVNDDLEQAFRCLGDRRADGREDRDGGESEGCADELGRLGARSRWGSRKRERPTNKRRAASKRAKDLKHGLFFFFFHVAGSL